MLEVKFREDPWGSSDQFFEILMYVRDSWKGKDFEVSIKKLIAGFLSVVAQFFVTTLMKHNRKISFFQSDVISELMFQKTLGWRFLSLNFKKTVLQMFQ